MPGCQHQSRERAVGGSQLSGVTLRSTEYICLQAISSFWNYRSPYKILQEFFEDSDSMLCIFDASKFEPH